MERRGGASQGEALATWAMWAVVLAIIFVTYWRLPPDTPSCDDDLYHVSGNGLVGGLSRVLVELNFPLALVAIVVVLVAVDALPRRAWAVAGPAIGLCGSRRVAWRDRPGRSRRTGRQRDPGARRGALARPDRRGFPSRRCRPCAAAPVRPGAGDDRSRPAPRLDPLDRRRPRRLPPRRCLHHAAGRPRHGRTADRRRPPRTPPRDGRDARRAQRDPPLAPTPAAGCDRVGDGRGDVARVRLWDRQLRSGRLERAAREARHARPADPVRDPPLPLLDLARDPRARRAHGAHPAPRVAARRLAA